MLFPLYGRVCWPQVPGGVGVPECIPRVAWGKFSPVSIGRLLRYMTAIYHVSINALFSRLNTLDLSSRQIPKENQKWGNLRSPNSTQVRSPCGLLTKNLPLWYPWQLYFCLLDFQESWWIHCYRICAWAVSWLFLDPNAGPDIYLIFLDSDHASGF